MSGRTKILIRNYESKDREKVAEFHKRILSETGAYIPGIWDEDLDNVEVVWVL